MQDETKIAWQSPSVNRAGNRTPPKRGSRSAIPSTHGVRATDLAQAPRSARAGRLRAEQLAMVAHELRNGLGAILGVIRIATRAPPGPADRTADIDRARLLIEHQVGGMVRLIEDLLEVAVGGAWRPRLRCDRVDLCAVVKQAFVCVEPQMSARKHRLTMKVPIDPIWLDADSRRLEQVFINLLVNAAKYTNAGGEIAVLVERHHGCGSVRIRDSGIGIAPEQLSGVFDLYMQAEPSAVRSENGRGIGLAVVRSLVEMHDGSVTVASAGLGQGSEFTVRLPAVAG